MPWPFSKSKKDKAYWLDWVKKQQQAGVSLNILHWKLLDNPLKLNLPAEEVMAKHEAAREIFNIMVQRNLGGARLEKEGRLDEAIKLYEQNLKDQFAGTHPYERLRIIYTKRSQYSEAIRVCQAFLALPGNGKVEKFLEHVSKLKAKL